MGSFFFQRSGSASGMPRASNTHEDYYVKVAQTLDEACKLLEVGFEHVTDMEGAKLFRKRK